jgi:hypothetical protein
MVFAIHHCFESKDEWRLYRAFRYDQKNSKRLNYQVK